MATFSDRSRWPVLLFALLAAVVGYAFLFAPVTVSLDGYSHLYGAAALRWMVSGLPEARDTFSYNSILLPNWLSALVLAALSSVVSNELALKLLVVAIGALLHCSLYFCVAAVPLGTRARPRASRNQRAQMLVVLLPFALNSFLILGYYGFLISTSLCLLVLGLLIRHGLAMPLQLQLVSAALLLVAYTSHPFPVAISFLYPCAYVLAEAMARWREGRLGSTPFGRHALAMWPWLPPAALVLWFSLRLVRVDAPDVDAGAAVAAPRLLAAVRGVALSISPGAIAGTATAPGTYPPTAWLIIALMILLVVGVVLRARNGVWATEKSAETGTAQRDPVRFTTLAALVVVSLALSAILPDRVGDGSGIVLRIQFHAALFLVLLAFANGAFHPRLLTLCCMVAALSVVGFARQYQLAARALAPALAEVRSAMRSIPVSSRVLILGYRMTPMCEGGPLLKMTFPERHAAMSGALENQLIVMNDYQAHTSHFPLRQTNSRYGAMVDEFTTYSEAQREAWLEALQGGTDVEYVVSWGVSGSALCRNTVGAPYEYTLSGAFDRIRLDEGLSRVELWRRRE